jgi:hypothetical protein
LDVVAVAHYTEFISLEMPLKAGGTKVLLQIYAQWSATNLLNLSPSERLLKAGGLQMGAFTLLFYKNRFLSSAVLDF